MLPSALKRGWKRGEGSGCSDYVNGARSAGPKDLRGFGDGLSRCNHIVHQKDGPALQGAARLKGILKVVGSLVLGQEALGARLPATLKGVMNGEAPGACEAARQQRGLIVSSLPEAFAPQGDGDDAV